MQEALASGDLPKARKFSAAAQGHGEATLAQKAAAGLVHGSLSLQLGDYAAAVSSLQTTLAHDASNWHAAINLASAFNHLEQWEDAVHAARLAIAKQPTVVAAHVVLSQSLHMAGDLRGALTAAREAVRLESASVPQPAAAACEAPWLVLGELLVDLHELDEAWQLALTAAAAAEQQAARPSSLQPSQMAKACLLAGRVQEAAGQYEKSLDAYAKAAHLSPSLQRASHLRVRAITRTLRAALPAKRGDVFIATYPKSGTTWMQLIACMLSGEGRDVDVHVRAPYIEGAVASRALSVADLRELPSPRLFKTHAAWPDLPVAGCTPTAPPDGAKVIVVVRDPRDVMVSLFHHSRSIAGISYGGSWDEWFEVFVSGAAPLPMVAASGGDGAADWFLHTLGWWRIAQDAPSQVLWVRYEELLDAPLAQIQRVAAFLSPDTPPRPALLQKIVEATRFGEMKRRHEANHGAALRKPGATAHFRRGVAGDWRNQFSAEQRERFQRLMRERLAGSGHLEQGFL